MCANLAEAWRKRTYPASFVAKVADAEAEAAESQTWVAFAVRCGYLDRADGVVLHTAYEEVIRMLVAMRANPEKWAMPARKG